MISKNETFLPGTKKCSSCGFHWLPQVDNEHPRCPSCGCRGDIVDTQVIQDELI